METIYIWRKNASFRELSFYKRANGSEDSSWSDPFKESGAIAFRKPKRPTRTQPASDGYRKPTAYAAGVDTTCGSGTLSGSSGRIPSVWGGYREHFVEGSIVMTCMGANPKSLLSEAASINSLNRLRTQVRNNIADEVFDVSMVLAEMQSTVDTATSMLNRIGRSMLLLKKRRPQSFYYLLEGRRRDGRKPTDKFLRTTAQEYLQWKYGIMPSVYDLQGALKAMDINEKGSLFDNPPLMTARSSVSDTSTRLLTASSGWMYPLPGIPFTIKKEVKARCDFSVKSEGLRGLNRYGVGLSSIPTILWDKTPFTFVLNMAVPISSLIKAWGALSGVNVRSYCETIHASSRAKGTTKYGWKVIDYEFPEVSSFRRNVYAEPPLPMPYVQNPIKTGNLATVLALFTSLRK